MQTHTIPKIVWESLLLIRKIVAVFPDFVYDINYFNRLIDLVVLWEDPKFINCGLRVLSWFVKGLRSSIVSDYFPRLIEIIQRCMDDPKLDFNDSADAQRQILKILIERADKSRPEPIFTLLNEVCLPRIHRLLHTFTTECEHRDHLLVSTLYVLCDIVKKLKRTIIHQLPEIVALLFLSLSYHHAMLFEEVLPVLSIVVGEMGEEMREYRNKILQIVHDGLISENMEIIGSAGLLLSDVFRFVDHCQIIPDLSDIYRLFERRDDDRFLSCFPSLVRAIVFVGTGFFEIGSFILTSEQLGMLFEVTDRIMRIPIDVNDEEDLKQGANSCVACFEAYTFYFKLRETETPEPEVANQELMRAKTLLRSITTTLWKTQAITETVLMTLCAFIKQIGMMFKGKISMDLNQGNVKNLLRKGMESRERGRLYLECERTFTFVERLH
jgi:hypothetical protein